MTTRTIRVLVVDDSALVRKVITSSLEPFKDIEVVGTAPDPYVARDKLLALNPDVLTLDIEMPRMDGLTFLKLIMKHRPTPVIVFSSLSGTGSAKALEALQAGAVDVLGKPGNSYSAFQDGSILADKIRAAAQARIRMKSANNPEPVSATGARTVSSPARGASSVASAPSRPPVPISASGYSRDILLMGASTGGTEALKSVLTRLPAGLPGICIVQHIPSPFSKAFADRLNELCQFEVHEAVHGDVVRPSSALIAPGGRHMSIRWRATHYVAELNDGPPVHHQRPAVDVLFDSAAKAGAGPHALVVLLTGMGADGAIGMLSLFKAGASTIAQDEESCVVFGMPREAIRLGAAQQVLPLDQIPARIVRHFASYRAPVAAR
jgi:two-component system chemotaxis response regulator CheB